MHQIAVKPIYHLIGLTLAFVAISCSGSNDGDNDAQLEATPDRTELAQEAPLIKERLQAAAERLAEADSVETDVEIDIEFDDGDYETLARLVYVAPTTLSGVIELELFEAPIHIEDDVTFIHNGRDWLQLEGLSYGYLREYSGGLIDVAGLVELARDPIVIEQADDSEVIAARVTGDFNSYLVRLVEWPGLGRIFAYRLLNAEFTLDRTDGRLERLALSGNAERIGGTQGPFEIVLEFDSYNDSEAITSKPDEATPIGAINTPTPYPARGSALGTSFNVDADLGVTFHKGQQVAVAIDYRAPECRNVLVQFAGEYVEGSPRYQAVCKKQCGDAIGGFMSSEPVTLDSSSGTVRVEGAPQPFAVRGETIDAIEGFRLCSVTVQFSDGLLGGTFYHETIGDPDC